jgi:hypothetical protein
VIPKAAKLTKKNQKPRRIWATRISATGAPVTPLYAISGIAHRNKENENENS